MLIRLSDPIWSRLYGPCGNFDVTGHIGRLLNGWNKAIADELFGDRLHHQESFYPVTYASIPWLRLVGKHDWLRASALEPDCT
ncbi:hypothetical protein [Tabrizicola sp.]|uniref:hypothetical protein n=1 Tax=Tabrizicola sp. TaxID=2005166 RepID=UPI003F2FFDE5